MLNVYLVTRDKDKQTMLMVQDAEKMSKMIAEALGSYAFRLGTADPDIPEGSIGIVTFVKDATGWIDDPST
jgi:hypothetical protein